MISRNLNLPNSSCFLFGPRGTGKTSYLRAHYPNALYLDLLQAELFNKLLAHPERLEEWIPSDINGPVIIDEVQKVPRLLDEVHRLIEIRKLNFILTGSSARKLKQTQSNMLAGRALTFYMHPLSSLELKEQFDIDKALSVGLLPTLYDSQKKDLNHQQYLQTYIQTYLKEEVQQEGLTRSLDAFARFLEAASFSQGEVLNISNVARECHVSRKVVESYFQILEDLLIARTVPVFEKKAKRKLARHPKFYYFDVGVYRSLRPKGPLDSPEEIEGAALETFLFQEIQAWVDYENLQRRLYYWRTQAGNEVDMVIYGDDGLWAIEMKRSQRFDKREINGLKSFKQDYPMAKCIFIYGGKDKLEINNIQVLPLEDFIKSFPKLLK